MNVVTTIIKSRHSVRKFKPGIPDEAVIRDVLECAHLAPTARNAQAWLFGVVRDRGALASLSELAENGRFIRDAALCFATFGKRDNQYYLEDCCAATENLILALHAHGIGSCWVAGAQKPYAEQVRTMLKVPPEYTLVSLVAAGLPKEISPVPKKALEEVAFFDTYSEER